MESCAANKEWKTKEQSNPQDELENCCSPMELTFMHKIIEHDSLVFVSKGRSLAVVKSLMLARGGRAELNRPNPTDDRTPLHVAVDSIIALHMVRFLAWNGASVNHEANNG